MSRGPDAMMELLDWRRRVAELYAEVRNHRGDAAEAWSQWCARRDGLFARHPQSPLPAAQRERFGGLAYFPYDPALRATATVEVAEPRRIDVAASAGEVMAMTRVGMAHFAVAGAPQQLELFWLDGYAGGLFLAFRDATGGDTTYPACRYLLDTVKGADLGVHGDALVLDFNFAYQPSCSYDPRWACPLAPPANRLEIPIRAGERLTAALLPGSAGSPS